MKTLRKISCVVALLVLAVAGNVGFASAAGGELSGKVIETMDAGGYTYAQIEKDGKKTWVAVPQTKIDNGQEITFAPGSVMNNFESKTLKRSFESIIFSRGVVGKAK